MELTGKQFIGNRDQAEGEATFKAFSPQDGILLDPEFHEATESEVDQVAKLAEDAFKIYRDIQPPQRAEFLEAIAEEILALDHALLMRAENETSLPFGRLQGERGRTVNQLRLFAELIREGSWVDARIDTALPAREPIPKPDIRSMLRPLGPVAVFGASNFPLAFSVAGGDTASALASGCPVVVKGHPAHPGTSELTARAILKAAERTAMPNGVFSMLQGQGHEVGAQLVRHPLIQAVAFTGSFRGGKALYDIANRREIPIPVFAEMGSTNPVFILPEALEQQSDKIAAGLASSITLGVGQFCTNPGLTFSMHTDHLDSFKEALTDQISTSQVGTMLTEGIQRQYKSATAELAEDPVVTEMSKGAEGEGALAVAATLFQVDAGNFLQRPEWSHEIFGPASILVTATEKDQLLQVARGLDGHLTATLHGTTGDLKEFGDLINILERKVGRLIINGYPTGVEVCPAMVHGGPYPATTAPHTTSVGTRAIRRFVRPVCFQDFPQFLLPEEIQDNNPQGIYRLVDGAFSKEKVKQDTNTAPSLN